jgi:translation elongation factor EF-G
MPKIRESVMRVRVTTPAEFLGDIMGDLNARRAQVEGMEEPQAPGQLYTVVACVLRRELFNYATDLRSMTQGRGSFEMEFSHYQDWGSDDAPDDGAGVPSPLKPSPPTRSASAAAQPPPDDTPAEHD